MLYRRKLLLALVEAFGGELKRTDCLKLLLLYCQHAGKNHYDFFPYKFGGFSFLAYQDKLRLAQLGFLSEGEDFQLCGHQSFLDQVKPSDRQTLQTVSAMFGQLRGRPLIRHTYLAHPQYASRSEILADVLSPQEIEQLSLWWNTNRSTALFTIGYEGRTIDSYLNTLISNNILVVVDVRKNANSMKYGFSKTKLGQYVQKAGMEYVHLPDLGIPARLRSGLSGDEAYQRLFHHYEFQILPQQSEAIDNVGRLLSQHRRIALTCFEADHHLCHRHKITDHVQQTLDANLQVVHL